MLSVAMAARKRRVKDDPSRFIPTPDRQLEHPSGFCITGHHNNCKYQFDHGKCGCDCHHKKKLVKGDNPTTTLHEGGIQDPRPWVK